MLDVISSYILFSISALSMIALCVLSLYMMFHEDLVCLEIDFTKLQQLKLKYFKNKKIKFSLFKFFTYDKFQ